MVPALSTEERPELGMGGGHEGAQEVFTALGSMPLAVEKTWRERKVQNRVPHWNNGIERNECRVNGVCPEPQDPRACGQGHPLSRQAWADGQLCRLQEPHQSRGRIAS